MNAVYAANFSIVPNIVALLLSACGEIARHKDDEKDVVAEGYDQGKGIAFVVK
jgi:hypothetical protein